MNLNQSDVYEIEGILQKMEGAKQYKAQIRRLKEIMEPVIEKQKVYDAKQIRNIKWSSNGFTPHKKLQEAINIFSQALILHQEAVDAEKEYEQETQDLLHSFEFLENDDTKLIEYGKTVEKIRKSRRESKNFQEVIQPLVTFLTTNKESLKELGHIHEEMIGIMRRIEHRRYTPRRLTTFKEAFDNAAVLRRGMQSECLSLQAN